MTGATIFYKIEDQNLMLPKMTNLYLARFITGWYHGWCRVSGYKWQNVILEISTKKVSFGDCNL